MSWRRLGRHITKTKPPASLGDAGGFVFTVLILSAGRSGRRSVRAERREAPSPGCDPRDRGFVRKTVDLGHRGRHRGGCGSRRESDRRRAGRRGDGEPDFEMSTNAVLGHGRSLAGPANSLPRAVSRRGSRRRRTPKASRRFRLPSFGGRRRRGTGTNPRPRPGRKTVLTTLGRTGRNLTLECAALRLGLAGRPDQREADFFDAATLTGHPEARKDVSRRPFPGGAFPTGGEGFAAGRL